MNIGSYYIQKKLYLGHKFQVYRGTSEETSQNFILKVFNKKDSQKDSAYNNLKNEYRLLKKIDSKYVVTVKDWVETDEYACIVLEDIQGISLKEVIQQRKLTVEKFLCYANSILKGLFALHQNNIIHQDINPHNIVINQDTGQVNIIDLDISSEFNFKFSFSGNPEKLKGTLQYISPEQTGRIHHWVDQRSDLYSLGVTFYEMISGQLPYTQKDPLEIVYSHLAQNAEPLKHKDPSYSVALSDIIEKLMSKNIENRYQSIEGLQFDLQQFSNLPGKSFSLGQKDYSGKLQLTDKLYGRKHEIQSLQSAYQKSRKGIKSFVTVSGYSGTGKTVLINELQIPVTKDRGYFVSGKFNQLQRTRPYLAMIQALNQFCEIILTESSTSLEQWANIIQNAVNGLGKVLTDLVPKLESIIGEQPAIPEVGGEEAERRFNYVFQNFIRATSTAEHPFVLFIDDLQWADHASLRLIRILLKDTQINHFLFVGSYRNNEISPTHPLNTTLNEMQGGANLDITEIEVGNLSIQHIQEWLTEILKTPDHNSIISLSHLLYQKTQGNAFFTIQFLKTLIEERLLQFDYTGLCWNWDIRKIQKRNITDNVIDLLIHKINTLPESTQHILKLAACVGHNFSTETLQIISKQSFEQVKNELISATAEGFVFKSSLKQYQFEHDRIHQAAYSLISENEKQSLHLKIGRILLDKLLQEQNDKNFKFKSQLLFEVVNHLNTGSSLIKNENERKHLVKLNFEAAQKSRLSAAFSHGLNYIKNAIALLPVSTWSNEYEFTLKIYNEGIQQAYLNKDYKWVEALSETISKHSKHIQDQFTIFEYRIRSLIIQNNPSKAVDTVIDIFHDLGLTIPRTPNKASLIYNILKTSAGVKRFGIENFKSLPTIQDPKIELIIRLFYNGITAIMFGAGNQELLPYTICRMMDLTMRYGKTVETPFILAMYGMVKCFMGNMEEAYTIGTNVVEILHQDKTPDSIKVRAMCPVSFYLIGNKQNFKKSAKQLIDLYPLALNVGDFEYASYILVNYIQWLHSTDLPLISWSQKKEEIQNWLVQINQTLFLAIMDVRNEFNTELATYSNKSPLTKDDITDFSHELTKDFPESSIVILKYIISINRLKLLTIFNNNKLLLNALKELQKCWKDVITPMTIFRSDYFFYSALAAFRLYSTAPQDEKKSLLKVATKGLKAMKQWAAVGPDNFLNKYLLLKAEHYRVTGKSERSFKLYDQSIDISYKNNFTHEAAIACELAALHHLEQNRERCSILFY